MYESLKKKDNMDYQTGHVMTLANSIIGVSVLAMPYCFKQCGIVLSILLLLISSIISRLACHFLLKSAITARRRTFEFLAFYIFGAMGKFAIEIGIIGFLIGTCIAFFVVMGDLGPEIIAEITGSYTTNTMRTSILMALALFCVLPLGLLRNVDSLNGVSKATIGFYCCLVLKIVFEGIPHIFSGDWYHNVNFWRPAGILQCLPIFTMALFCQTQLFEIYQALQNATLEEMNNLVRVAVNICTMVYIFVGIFGYIAFFQKPFTGNILLSFSPSLMTDVIKLGFILSVAFSFPLVIFPCRASLYSLLYREGYPLHEGVSTYIPEGRFKGLTLFIVFISLIIGIMIPNIELVLGLVGSTIGVMICVLFPATCFICISQKNTNERILAQIMLMIGIFVMVLGTYKNLYSLDNLEPNTVTISSLKNLDQLDLNLEKVVNKIDTDKGKSIEKIPTTAKASNVEIKVNVAEKASTMNIIVNEELKEVRHEPPQPIEPIDEPEDNNNRNKKEEVKEEEKKNLPKVLDISNKVINDTKNDEVDIEAIKKEDKEVEQQEKEKINEEGSNQMLIDKIQKQNEVQMEIVEQQKKLNEEKVKAMKEIESIARQAIEKISGGKNDDGIVANVEKQIKENVKLDIEEKLDTNENIDNKNDKNSNNILSGRKEFAENNNNVINKDLPNQLVIGPDSFIEEQKKEQNALIKQVEDNSFKSNIETIKNGNSEGNSINKKITVENTDDTNIKRNISLAKEKESDSANNKKEEQILNQNINKETKPADTIIKDNAKESELKITKVNNSSLRSNTSNLNVNNTAPLFLKLGKPDVKQGENNVNKMIPLPLIVSGNMVNSSGKPESPPLILKDTLRTKQIKEAPLDSKEDQNLMRRDILSLKSKR